MRHLAASLISASVASLLLTGCGHVATGPTQRESAHFDLDNSELTRVELTMGAGEMFVTGGSPKLAEAEFSYNVPGWKPRVEYHSTGVRGDLVIRQPDTGPSIGDIKYRWDVKLNDNVQMDVVAKLGAGEATLELGHMNLRNVDLNIGVGEVKMDLRGNPRRSYDVRIHGGVGEATVRLPANVAIDATAEGGIGEINVSGLEKRGDRWINPSQESSPVKIHLEVKGGVGEIRLIAE